MKTMNNEIVYISSFNPPKVARNLLGEGIVEIAEDMLVMRETEPREDEEILYARAMMNFIKARIGPYGADYEKPMTTRGITFRGRSLEEIQSDFIMQVCECATCMGGKRILNSMKNRVCLIVNILRAEKGDL